MRGVQHRFHSFGAASHGMLNLSTFTEKSHLLCLSTHPPFPGPCANFPNNLSILGYELLPEFSFRELLLAPFAKTPQLPTQENNLLSNGGDPELP